ncbi:MAG: glycosyltransferase family 4 protein [Clostridia bacterium]|nr:glycosyltransferase family 4 protein [Clostridia bacterium]
MNILLALMGLDIGGAETHVVTLAKALKNKGYNVVVVSSGGVYEASLKASNIAHVYAPLAEKSPKAIVKSVVAMRRAVKTYHVDIIHTHGRIPSLIGGVVATLTKSKFMTTVHAMYKLNSYKWLSLFGKETICISDDIRQHVIRNYNVEKEKITVIPNCIDTNLFVPGEESGSTFTVGYVSRMEGELADRAIEVAEMLTDYAYREHSEIKLLIVGDGLDFNRVVSQVNQISKRIADQDQAKMIEILLLGKRTDIPDLMHQMDVVVCVSRVALEAMSCGKPVILLGGEGYEGLLTKESYAHAKGSNFTGRTSTMVFEGVGFIEQIDSLRKSPDYRRKLGEWGRARIEESYSIDQIVDETIKIYKSL